MTSDPITAGLRQETDVPPDDSHIADTCTYCHVVKDRQMECGGVE